VARLSIVIPVYNEETTIGTLLEAVRSAPLPEGLDREILVINDGSTDGTRARLDQTPPDSVIRVLNQEPNQGKGAAIRRGFAEATGDFVIVQDADLEYNPNEYSRLLEPILQDQADVVYGSRFIGGDSHRVLYFWHSVGNRFLTLLSNMVTNLNLTDMETCYKMFRIEIVRQLDLRENRFGIEPEITARVARLGVRIYEVGISYAGRTYAEGKKIGWRDGVRAILCILKYGLFR